MKHDVACADADMSLYELAKFLNNEGIHGAPVVDASGRLVGVVSYTDLVRGVQEQQETEAVHPWYWSLDTANGAEALGERGGEADFPGARMRVSEVMSRDILTATLEATAGQLAGLMLEHRVRRVLITGDAAMKGIVSSTDLLGALIDYEEGVDCEEGA